MYGVVGDVQTKQEENLCVELSNLSLQAVPSSHSLPTEVGKQKFLVTTNRNEIKQLH